MQLSAINPNTHPNLHQQKNKVARSATAKKFHVIYTADEVRKLPLSHPHRVAYQVGGDPAVRKLLAAS